ncbi:hypothetical protein CEXT_350051 [Caerostris extrusa]|uniref:BTB domain-containing protein n=1 Tax=Caerostris extrusa TaxID=172846 RepID=A0AAV4P754_CAEEX|nr:hypothetical protein CEXT_350051 [Caerostris extrusa]
MLQNECGMIFHTDYAVKYRALVEMLRVMYTGELDTKVASGWTSDFVNDFCAAAGLYDFPLLKKECAAEATMAEMKLS